MQRFNINMGSKLSSSQNTREQYTSEVSYIVCIVYYMFKQCNMTVRQSTHIILTFKFRVTVSHHGRQSESIFHFNMTTFTTNYIFVFNVYFVLFTYR